MTESFSCHRHITTGQKGREPQLRTSKQSIFQPPHGTECSTACNPHSPPHPRTQHGAPQPAFATPLYTTEYSTARIPHSPSIPLHTTRCSTACICHSPPHKHSAPQPASPSPPRTPGTVISDSNSGVNNSLMHDPSRTFLKVWWGWGYICPGIELHDSSYVPTFLPLLAIPSHF